MFFGVPNKRKLLDHVHLKQHYLVHHYDQEVNDFGKTAYFQTQKELYSDQFENEIHSFYQFQHQNTHRVIT